MKIRIKEVERRITMSTFEELVMQLVKASEHGDIVKWEFAAKKISEMMNKRKKN